MKNHVVSQSLIRCGILMMLFGIGPGLVMSLFPIAALAAILGSLLFTLIKLAVIAVCVIGIIYHLSGNHQYGREDEVI